MAEPTPAGGASQSDAAPLDKTIGATPNAKKPGRDPVLSARDELMAKVDKQVEEQRAADYERFLTSSDVDPRAAALAAAMQAEARGERVATDRGSRDLEVNTEEGREPTTVDGAASVQPADAAEKQAREAVRISHKGEDPLGEYVVRVEGKPMFKTVVDGKEVLVPLDRARTQLQKHLAADIRLQQAAEQRRQLEAREKALRTREASVPTRSHPSATAPAIDDRKLATELVRSLVSETEDKAAAKMAETFKAIRQAAAPQIDTGSITRLAREEAQRTVAEEREKEALGNGFEQFTKDYPEIAGDSDLFALADRKSDTIAAEHPDWKPAQIMEEAGRQTRDWLKSIGAPVRTGGQPKTPSGNQQRKQNLVPMPQPNNLAPALRPEAQEDGSPASMLAEIRKSRGQPY